MIRLRVRNDLLSGFARGTIPQTQTAKRALLDRRRQRMPRLVKKGSLTTCLITDSAGALGNSGIKSDKE